MPISSLTCRATKKWVSVSATIEKTGDMGGGF